MAGKEQLNLKLGTSSCTVAVLSMEPYILGAPAPEANLLWILFLICKAWNGPGLSEAHITDFLGL